MKRLKIAEQIILLLIVAVLLPLIVIAIIITNVNQLAVRKELNVSASIIADSVYHRLIKNIDKEKQLISNISESIKHISPKEKTSKYLKDVLKNTDEVEKIEILNFNDVSSSNSYIPDFSKKIISVHYDKDFHKLIISKKLDKYSYLKETIDIKKIEKEIFSNIKKDARSVYIVGTNKELLMSLNKIPNNFNFIISHLPSETIKETPIEFAPIENQPNVLLNIREPEWSIIVTTPRYATSYGIIDARLKIILSIVIVAALTFILYAGYAYSLYTNIRQLFKAITALGMGNYGRRIRTIKNLFTPYEIVFLAKEFNQMAERIDSAYSELQEKNEKLKKLDTYKSNLLDTVSHEFRTPLTSIKGYTSRLLRHDVVIDEETRIKSLKVIKQQTERLSRMVDDLLVIPDIESSLLHVNLQEINLKDIIETAVLSLGQKHFERFKFSINENFPLVLADVDRVEQVLINILDNALKYAIQESKILITAEKNHDFALIKVKNKCMPIPEDVLNSLFNKFTRLDDDMTRTTRGTGLGLFIVKGLIEAMQGEIKLSSADGFEVAFTLPLAVIEEENL